MSAFCVGATYQPLVRAGAASHVRAIVHLVASDLGDDGVDVSLRLWTALGVTPVVLRERAPAAQELRGYARAADDQTVQYAAGRWRNGARDIELVIALPAGRAGDQIQAARLDAVVGGEVSARTAIILSWTDDERLLGAACRPVLTAGAEQIAELPTGPSPTPRHTISDESAAAKSCPACNLRASHGDRFCERCGHELAIAQKS